MNRKSVYVFIILSSMLFTAQVQGKEDSNYKSMYSKGALSVVLSNNMQSKNQLSAFGKSSCKSSSFCLIWYFFDSAKAKVGVERAKSGNWSDPIPGLVAIYSKNKMINKIICYEPKASC